MNLNQIISLISGFSGFKDGNKTTIKDFIKENLKFSLILASFFLLFLLFMSKLNPEMALIILNKIIDLISK